MNNAALNYYMPTETYPTNRWVRCFAINVHAPFILSKEVLKDMIPARIRRDRQHQFRLGDRSGPWSL